MTQRFKVCPSVICEVTQTGCEVTQIVTLVLELPPQSFQLAEVLTKQGCHSWWLTQGEMTVRMNIMEGTAVWVVKF